MSYVVEFTEDAEDDITRLYAFLLERAETLEDLDLADAAVKIIRETTLYPMGSGLAFCLFKFKIQPWHALYALSFLERFTT